MSWKAFQSLLLVLLLLSLSSLLSFLLSLFIIIIIIIIIIMIIIIFINIIIMKMLGLAAGWGPAGLDKQRRQHSGGVIHSAHWGTEHHGLQCAAVQLPPLLQPGLLPLHLLQGEHCHQHGHPFRQGECVSACVTSPALCSPGCHRHHSVRVCALDTCSFVGTWWV